MIMLQGGSMHKYFLGIILLLTFISCATKNSTKLSKADWQATLDRSAASVR